MPGPNPQNSKTLYQGAARTDLSRPHGTTVTVRNLFNAIPVRQAAMASSTSSSLSACKRVIESLALARPQVRWTLWEERPGGARKVVSIQGGKTALDVFRMLYGNAGVEKVQKVRVSAGDRRADGFISLEGAATKVGGTRWMKLTQAGTSTSSYVSGRQRTS